MIKDPVLRELIDKGPKQFLTRRQKFERYLLWVVSVVTVVLVGGYFVATGIARQANHASKQANASVQGSCQFWHDLSVLPLSANSSKTGFTIIADARIAYARQDCTSLDGALPKPDPRVLPFLPPSLR